MLRVGAHLSKGKNLADPIHQIIEAGGNALQIFLSPPVNSSCGTQFKDSEVETINQMRENNNFYLVVHGKYILNFARPREKNSEWQFKCLKDDLIQANRIGSDVIIHQGKNLATLKTSEQEAETIFAKNISEILLETPELTNRIILENSCHQGNEMGYTIEQLARIFDQIDVEIRSRIGFCLDLCHLYVAGTCDLRNKEAVDQLFEDFDRLIGTEYLTVIHFNDSKICLGGRNDHHADLMIGEIGNPNSGGSSEGFKRVVEICQMRSLPMILETPRQTSGLKTVDQVRLIRSWADDSAFEKEYLNSQSKPSISKVLAKPIVKPKVKLPKPKIRMKTI